MSASPKIDDDRVLVITREFDAPRALVWAAWIDFNHAQNWMGAPGHPMKSMQNDLRAGGHWRNVMRHDGKEMPRGWRLPRNPRAAASLLHLRLGGARWIARP
jgi:hypothetical protein